MHDLSFGIQIQLGSHCILDLYNVYEQSYRAFTAIFNLTTFSPLATSCGVHSTQLGGDGDMIRIDKEIVFLEGPKGLIAIKADDEITLRLGMLFEGECEGVGAAKAAEKYGLTRQRYHQLLQQFKTEGAEALRTRKRGPKSNYRRTHEVERQIIRYRFLDPQMSAEVIAQKLAQCGYPIAVRSVERVISDYGLQKKTLFVSSADVSDRNRDPSNKGKSST